MQFTDYSSAFNTIVSTKLITKLRTLGLNTSLCSCILDFLKGRHQVARVGHHTSATLILNTGAPQRGACLVPSLLYSLFAKHNSSTIIKFADDTKVVGLITDNDETVYMEGLRDLAVWCQDNNLSLNLSKTKELIVDYSKRRAVHAPIHVNGAVVERVQSLKFLGVLITNKI